MPRTAEYNRGLEDAEFSYFGLEGINDLLEIVKRKFNDLQYAKELINDVKVYSHEIITPPSDNKRIEPSHGIGSHIAESHTMPRLQTLTYILITDEIIKNPEDLSITEGILDDDMVRESPYCKVEIIPCHRLMYVYDEEKNATYIFDTEKLESLGIDIHDIDLMTKEQKNEFIEAHNGVGVRYSYSPK